MGYKYNTFDICNLMDEDDCDNCGDYSKWQPCNEDIPGYIPDTQIKKWLLTRRDSYDPKVL